MRSFVEFLILNILGRALTSVKFIRNPAISPLTHHAMTTPKTSKLQYDEILRTKGKAESYCNKHIFEIKGILGYTI